MNYHVADSAGNRQGPWPEQEVIAKIQAGQLPASSLVWTDGMADWQPASSVFPQLTPAPLSSNPYHANPAVAHLQTFEKAPPNYLILSIIATLFCCLPFGIVAIIQSSKVNSLWAAGLYDQARKASKSALIWCIVCAISAVLVSIPSALIFSKLYKDGADRAMQSQQEKMRKLQQEQQDFAPTSPN